jgi:hypothetical protein
LPHAHATRGYEQSGRALHGPRARDHTYSDLCSYPAAKKAPREAKPVVTGFEGCLPLFDEPAVHPTYKPAACQPYHSGKVRERPAYACSCLQAVPAGSVAEEDALMLHTY